MRGFARIQNTYGLDILLLLIFAYLVDSGGHFGKRVFLNGKLLEEIAADAFPVANTVLLPGANTIHRRAARAGDTGNKAFNR